jgi:hypothetical protein
MMRSREGRQGGEAKSKLVERLAAKNPQPIDGFGVRGIFAAGNIWTVIHFAAFASLARQKSPTEQPVPAAPLLRLGGTETVA